VRGLGLELGGLKVLLAKRPKERNFLFLRPKKVYDARSTSNKKWGEEGGKHRVLGEGSGKYYKTKVSGRRKNFFDGGFFGYSGAGGEEMSDFGKREGDMWLSFLDE